ncbi:flagellar hook-length control protein FliK [Campylobacter upsaliensis]|uniref:Flagellar hook-length control protein FliK n=1 Tax=Campylobacter upsaliensis TaxID=28080 RepID=A0A5L8YAY6_CAMUP|nr:flagellar hook-length control protein FliK [Campylobacter upsaliensis]EAH5216730.1 flagellar hook-length control protein FliK [Campylobacter upsaliensis]EAH6228005.1 flagellar hook-length control protein FliK [Campylobacter upsaliensis]EAH9850530.1 flagellar hook-length control protein FliK [Campylobacter upsaliensis]EAI4339484.1 flagellar hook-length control protein FliK [Campylobacter upsaliensis]EAJ0885851.1 flagellar hook-length control protein FliK [Campylobacter upsaliensis]
MSNLAPQSEILNLAPSKTSQASFSKTIKNNPKEEKAGENERESFLNSLLASIEETNEHLPTHMKISESEIVGEVMQKLQIGNFDEGDKISVFESAPLMQILSVLDKLKTDLSNVKLANLANNNTLLQLIKNENNFNALKNANSLGELLNLAKDMGLEVRDIKVDRLLDLKATFPNLDKKDFFKGAIDNVFKEVLNHKLAHIEKNLDTNLHTQNKTPIKTNEANSLLSKTLQNLDSLIKKEDKTRQLNQGKKESDEETELKTPIKTNKNEILNEVVEKFSQKTKINEKETQSKETFKLKEEIKEPNLEPKKENLSTQKENLKTQKEDLKEMAHLGKEPLNKSDENVNLQEKTKSPLKEAVLNATLGKDVAKETIKETLNVKDFMQKEFTQKETSKENLKDVKLNHLSEGLKITSENLTKVVQNKTSENLFSELLNKETNKELFTKENGENTANTEKSGIDDLNNLVKDLSRVNQNQKIISPKETLQYFSKDLKEAMEQYKAPITKLSITLNPSNLGEVEVTLVQRGANLHINFNSNHNAMNLFLQHQAEFKNSLVNMGFTGLEMNFSDQGKKEQQQEKKSKSHYYEENFEEESGPKINLELVLAKYF